MKYVSYLRVSTDKQEDEGASIYAQRSVIESYMKDHQQMDEFFEAKSGKNITGRPEMQKALALCKEKGYTLVVAKLSRLGRNVDDARYIFDLLDGNLRILDLPVLDKAMLTMLSLIYETERENISKNTKAVLDYKREQGIIGGNPQMKRRKREFNHYRRMGANAMKEKAKQNENNKKAFSLIKSMRENKRPYEDIAEELNKNGYKTSRGNSFTEPNVKRIYYQMMDNT